MKNQIILRNALISVSVLFALTQRLAAGTSGGVLTFSKAPLVPPHPTFITFDPPGSAFTVPSAITSKGLIIGSYIDTSGVTHGFLRRPGGTFITVDVPDSTSTTPTSITPGGVITGWYSDTIGNPHGFIRAPDGSITSFDAPPDDYILGSVYIFDGPPPSITPAGAIAGTYVAPGFVEHGFLRTPDGTFTTIDYPGAFFTEALAINATGVIAGDFCNEVTCFQGYVRTPDGTFTVIDANAGIPTAINPAGAITGFVLTGSAANCVLPTGPSPCSIHRAQYIRPPSPLIRLGRSRGTTATQWAVMASYALATALWLPSTRRGPHSRMASQLTRLALSQELSSMQAAWCTDLCGRRKGTP